MRVILAVIDLLIALLPRSFRNTFGREIRADFLDHWNYSARAHGGVSRIVRQAGLLFLACGNLLSINIAERFSSSLSPRHKRLKKKPNARRFSVFDVWNDIRYAVRSFRRTPALTTAIVLVLGVGIGSITLMFSVLNTAILRPLPLDQPDELVWLWSSSEADPTNYVAYLDYVDYRDGIDAIESLAAMSSRQSAILTGGGAAESVFRIHVSSNFFATVGARVDLGREFVPEEERVGRYTVAILSRRFWERRFGADPAAIGSTISLDEQPIEIVGVAQSDFGLGNDVDVWLPLQRDAGYSVGRANNTFSVVGRLRDGASIEQARAQADVVAQRIANTYPEAKADWWVTLMPLSDVLFGNARASLLMLLGLVTLVPLVACANVAALFLSRVAARQTEFACRSALGESRARSLRLLLTECLVVALAGGVAGLVLAFAGGEALAFLAPETLPRIDELGIDLTVLGFTSIVSLVTVPLFGIVPALRGTKLELAQALKVGGARGASVARSGPRNALVVAQVALSLTLMIASGLLFRSYARLQHVDTGFEAESVLSFWVQLPPLAYESSDARRQAWEEVRGSLAGVPGVLAVGSIDRLPIGGTGGNWNYLWPAERPPTTPADRMQARRRAATAGYFEAMQIPLLRGRLFETTDGPGSPGVTVINQTFAQRFFPGEDPLGKILVLPWSPPVNLEVVGIVSDILEVGPGSPPLATFYMAASQMAAPTMSWVARVDGNPTQFAQPFRRAIQDFDSDVPLSSVQTMDARISAHLSQPRFRSLLVGAFALVALLLASIGLYGVLAFLVRQRSKEICIRMALGAASGSVQQLVLRRGMTLVAVGIVCGIAASLVVGRLIQGSLFGVRAFDPLTFAAVTASLVGVALVACLMPARRAVRLEPVAALKDE